MAALLYKLPFVTVTESGKQRMNQSGLKSNNKPARNMANVTTGKGRRG